MAKDLKEYLAEDKAQGFRSVPHYFASGDFVTYYFRNDRCFAERVDDHLLTVYLSMDTLELVGCKIKGVKHILKTAGNFGVTVADGDVRLGMFFFYGIAQAKDENKKRYEQLAKAADASFSRKELQPV